MDSTTAGHDDLDALPGPSGTIAAPSLSPPVTQIAPENSSTTLSELCWGLKRKVDAFLAEEDLPDLLGATQAQLRVSIDVVREALHRYRADEISLSYNGGKDCLVLLIVVLACLAEHLPSPSSAPVTNGAATSNSTHASTNSLQSVYIVSPNPFAEVDSFVASSAQEYHLEVLCYAMPMKQGLAEYLKHKPSMRAIFVGTRRTDPHGEFLKHFDPTDKDWPRFMRVHPVIDWKYAEIWAFIRHLQIPYCSLYDQGYTSLGGTKDTHPNPHLKKADRQGFKPAYELVGDDEERLGRDR